MRLVPSQDDRLIFQLSAQEKDLFLAVVSFYPLLNPDYHRLTKTVEGQTMAEEQKLLREAMEEQRRDNKKKLAEFINGIDWAEDKEKQSHLILTAAQTDWLLQILNDVRVGAWDIVGRPNPTHGDKVSLQTKNSHYYGVMELSGLFQEAFLHALEKKNGAS